MSDHGPDEPPPDHHEEPLARQPRYNLAAEQGLLGALLITPELATPYADQLDPTDFYKPAHELIWQAIHKVAATGQLPDPALVLDQLQTTGELQRAGGAGYLHTCMAACSSPTQATTYARIILDTARYRSFDNGLTRVRQRLDQATPDAINDTLAETLDIFDREVIRNGARTVRAARHIETIDDLLQGDDEDTYDWVIPGLLERQDRLILTAGEGTGKSTLIRQIGVQAASGIHPFTGDDIQPITVLHIDVENTRRQLRRRYRPLRTKAGQLLDPARLRIEVRTAGIDLTTAEDRDWLLNTCEHIRPDLLTIGPVYKLANGDPTEEQSAKPVAMALDGVREAYDCAVLLEAHSAKAPAGKKTRPHEPYGWSGWLRWPEFGLWLDDNGLLKPWRGAREDRAWPEKLERGGDWPWSPAITELAERWNTIRHAREHHGRPMSIRELAHTTGLSRGTLARLVGKGAIYHYGWSMINGQAADEEETQP